MASSTERTHEGDHERVEKKVFTHWINSHLQHVTLKVTDLYEDLKDGHRLCVLIELLTGEKVNCEKGNTLHHKMQNVQNILDYLTAKRKMKLVNIHSCDITNGKATPTLGLVWRLILHFQISSKLPSGFKGSHMTKREMSTTELVKGLLEWAQAVTEGYDGVKIVNFHTSWRDGLAFCAILDRFRPDLIIYNDCDPETPLLNLEAAMTVAEKELGITRIIDPKDILLENPEEKSIMTYVSSLHNAFLDIPLPPRHEIVSLESIGEYNELFVATRLWIQEKMKQVTSRNFPSTVTAMKAEMSSFHAYVKKLQLKKRDMLTLKKTCHCLQEQENDNNVARVSKKITFDLLVAEWEGLERENRECDTYMEQELVRLKKLEDRASEVHTTRTSASSDQPDGEEKEDGSNDKHLDGETVTELESATDSVERDRNELLGLTDDTLDVTSIGAHPLRRYSHHHFDDNFPNICFLGEPLKFSVESKPVDISLPGINASLKIPRNAVPPDKKVDVTFGACLSGSFKYPEGYEPLSAVYLISVDSSFDKEVELTFEHFAEIQTKEHAYALKCFSAKSSLADGEKEYEFSQMIGAKLAVRESQCNLTTQHFCHVVVAAKHPTLKKRYGAVCTYAINDEVSHAAVAVSVANSGYIENFRKSLQDHWDKSAKLYHISMKKVSFKRSGSDARAALEFPQYVNGWNVVPDSTPCFFKEEDVNDLSADDLSMYDYPPRFIFDISPDEKAEPCTLKLRLTDMSENINFQIELVPHPSPSHSCLSTSTTTMPVEPLFGLDEIIGDTDLAKIARDLVTDWDSLTAYLGLNRPQREEIRRSYPGDYGKQKRECLEVWKEVKGNEATYRALIKAAEEAKAQNLADNLRKEVESKDLFQEQSKTEEKAVTRWQFQVQDTKENAGSCSDVSTTVQRKNHGLRNMVDEVCEWVAKTEGTLLATESPTQEKDIQKVEKQLLECETFQEEMAHYQPTMNTLMESAEKSESATLFIDDDISDRITDLNIRKRGSLPGAVLVNELNRPGVVEEREGKDLTEAPKWIDPAEKERLMQRYNVGPTRSNSRKQTDRNSQAVTLARKLYMLDGYRKSEVAEKLAQPTEFGHIVAREYLSLFDFTGLGLCEALRQFLAYFSLTGDSQERERVMQHFSQRYHQCNPHTLPSVDAVHGLSVAILLLNTDLHTDHGGRKMSSAQFTDNVGHIGVDLPKDMLKTIYEDIKRNPLQWALDDDQLSPGSTEQVEDEMEERVYHVTIPGTFVQAVLPGSAPVFKEGFVLRKNTMEAPHKKVSRGKRQWKAYYAYLKGFLLYFAPPQGQGELHLDDTSSAITVTHCLAMRAHEYHKKIPVVRVTTADWHVFLLQATDVTDMQQWIGAINKAAGLYSSPPLAAPIGSRSGSHRPTFPLAPTSNNQDQQIESHEVKVKSLEKEVKEHQAKKPMGKNAKHGYLEEWFDRYEFYQFEINRFRIYLASLSSDAVIDFNAPLSSGLIPSLSVNTLHNPDQASGESDFLEEFHRHGHTSHIVVKPPVSREVDEFPELKRHSSVLSHKPHFK